MSRAFALGLALLAAQAALAEARPLPNSSTIRAVKGFAEKRGLPMREVKAGPSWNEVTRLALPLTPTVWEELVGEIGLRKNPETGKFEGSLIFRQYGDDMVVVAPPDLGFGQRVYDPRSASGMTFGSSPGVIVHLSAEQADHVGRWLEARGKDRFFRWGNGCSDLMMNIEVEPGPDGTHTLRAISNEEAGRVAPARTAGGQVGIPGSGVPLGKSMAEHTGVRASRQGFYMQMKWAWSGNENVQVVLVPEGKTARKEATLVPSRLPDGRMSERAVLRSVERERAFVEMTPAELLGPQHPHGVDLGSRRPMARAAQEKLKVLEGQLRLARAELAIWGFDLGAVIEMEQIGDRLAALAQAIGYLRAVPNSRLPELEQEATELQARRSQLVSARLEPGADPEKLSALEQRIAALEAERDQLLTQVQP